MFGIVLLFWWVLFGFACLFVSVFTKVCDSSACVGLVSVWKVLDCLQDQELGTPKTINF